MFKKTLNAVLLILIFTGFLYSQEKEIIIEKKGMPDRGLHRLPDLTESQFKEMDKIHLKTMKEILPFQNQIGEKEARLRTLSTADNPDITQINSLIEEIGNLMISIRKTEMSSRLAVRELLSENQKIIFDMLPPGPPPNIQGNEIIREEKIRIEK